MRKKFTEYLDRAEKLKEYLAKSNNKKKQLSADGRSNKTDSDASEGEDETGKKKEDAESKKMVAALSSAILSEKPNVRWYF